MMVLRHLISAVALHGLLVNQADEATGIGGHEDWAEQYAAAVAIADAVMKKFTTNPSQKE